MNSKLARLAGALLLASVLPSCAPVEEFIDLTVTNQGTVAVDVKAERKLMFSGVEETDFSAEPGGSKEVQLTWPETYSLRVRVYRSTDHFELFDQSWNGQQILDRDRRLDISVSP